MSKQTHKASSNKLQVISNPTGKNGKPITLPPMTFDEAVKKMLATQPPKAEAKPKPTKKPARTK